MGSSRTRWRPNQGLADPGPVLLVGCRVVWSELTRPPEGRTDHGPDCSCGCRRPLGVTALDRDPESRVVIDRERCPNGCRHRDLARERHLGLNRICLRCYCWTHDPEGWRPHRTQRRVLPSTLAPSPEVPRTRRHLRALLYGRPLPPRSAVYQTP